MRGRRVSLDTLRQHSWKKTCISVRTTVLRASGRWTVVLLKPVRPWRITLLSFTIPSLPSSQIQPFHLQFTFFPVTIFHPFSNTFYSPVLENVRGIFILTISSLWSFFSLIVLLSGLASFSCRGGHAVRERTLLRRSQGQNNPTGLSLCSRTRSVLCLHLRPRITQVVPSSALCTARGKSQKSELFVLFSSRY